MQIISINENGAKKLTLLEIRNLVQNEMLAVFPNLTFDPASPDGFLLNFITDLLNNTAEILIMQAFNNDIDTAENAGLDKLGAIYGLQRQAGLQTIIDLEITVNRTVSLQGGVFQVRDRNQNLYTLLDNAIGLTVGTHTLTFQANSVGAFNPPLNTVNIIETPINGVVAVNNLLLPTIIGTAFEEDHIFRRRIKRSFSKNSLGYYESLLAGLLSIQGVVEAEVFINNTDVINSFGINPRTVACVVDGGLGVDIGAEILRHIAGQGTQGDTAVNVLLANGISELVNFSRPDNVPLFVNIELQNLGGYTDFDFLKNAIIENLKYSIGERASADTIIATIKNIPQIQIIVENVEISIDGITYVNNLTPAEFTERFVFVFANINVIEL